MPFDRWSSEYGGEICAPPRRPRKPPTVERFTVQQTLTRLQSRYPEIVDRARAKLVRAAHDWADGHGYEATGGSWDTYQDDSFETVTIRLMTEITPRMDGEWPAIRQALAEDEADREAAATDRTRVGDRLDALAASAAVWAACTPHEVREALREPSKRLAR